MLGPLALYVLTTSRTVMLEDDGLFLMAGAHLGIAHPPGYPLYIWLCHAFMQLPFGSPAFLGHLSSAVLGAFACGFVYWGARVLGASILPAVAAAWLFGASEHFWAQAIIAEVYTLHALLFFAAYALVLYGIRHRHLAWPWLWAAAAYGLSLANHWPLMGLSTLGLLLAVLPAWRAAVRHLPAMLGIALPCAILPYVWMVWRSWQEPLISFYGPIGGWEEFWLYLSRQLYAGTDVSAVADWGDRLAYLQWLGNELVWQLTLPGFLLALLGLFVLLRRTQLATVGSGLVILACNSLVLLMALNFEYNYFQVAVFRPYPLVCFGLLALWLAVGLQFAVDALARLRAGGRMGAPGFRHAVVGMAGLLMAGGSVHAHWESNMQADNDFTERFAAATLDSLPPDAVLLTTFDEDAFPLGYYSLVEGRRPDASLLHVSGLIYKDRLYGPFFNTERKRSILEAFVARTERPVFIPVGSDQNLLPRGYKGQLSGFYVQPAEPDENEGMVVVRNLPSEKFFLYLSQAQFSNRWERSMQNAFLGRYCHYLALAKISDYSSAQMMESMQYLYDAVDGHCSCMIAMAATLLLLGDEEHRAQAEDWVERVEARKHEILFEEDSARLYYLRGRIAELRGRKKSAASLYRISRTINPAPNNRAHQGLSRLQRAAPPASGSMEPNLSLP